MSDETFRSFIKDGLAGKSLIIVSNREPYVHKKTGASVKVEKPAGGLTSAMDEALRSTGGPFRCAVFDSASGRI